MSTSASTAFAELVQRFGLSDDQAFVLEAHYRLLLRWNTRLNLTKVTDLAEALERHYGESLFLAAHLPQGGWRVIDVGSGAGFPGFPLAVARPECSVLLLESHARKAVFLREASRTLRNIRVSTARAAQVVETFDWAVMRAVRYAGVKDVLHRIARRVAVLSGDEALPGFDAMKLPWGHRRFLHVSRETM